MQYFFISLVLSIVALILALYSIRTDRPKNRAVTIVGALTAIVGAALTFSNIKIPKPEIYTTNGQSPTDNEVYITAEWPLSIWYTLIPYGDPQKEGTKFEGNIAVEGTMTVSAKTRFLFGLKWSDLESKDIIVGSDGELDIIDTDHPGTSIQKINANLTGNRFFPGDTLKKEDIWVEGTTIAGETITIEDFDFTPDILVEGVNDITVNYKNLSDEISYVASVPKLVDINAEYIGDDLHEGDVIEAGQFKITGVYENGNQMPLEEFTLDPSKAEAAGKLDISIGAEDVSTTITVSVKEREYPFTLASELHTPNGSYDPNVRVKAWEENTDYSITGKTFHNGIKLSFENWMSQLMGNGRDFAEDVESNIYIAVNQEVLLKRPKKERYFSGQIVIGRDTNGSTTTAEISIYADGKEVYESGVITATSTQIPSFRIPATGIEQILIKTNANVCGNTFVIGIITE